jgi:hypothetical protein
MILRRFFFRDIVLPVVVLASSAAGCKGIDERRKTYAEELQKKVPQGCTVKPSMAALTIDCNGASDKKTAVESAQSTVKAECGAIGDLKISSVVVNATGVGWFENEIGGIAKGNCELKKR